ncbi:MAG: AroM family protein [Thermoanaerobacteraceae bacterium]|nr:AroM family protein [Thermoanaerobacteraceae bacterium]
MNKRIGTVTIGQSPRTDIIPEIMRVLGEVEIIERGALDGLAMEDINGLSPENEVNILVSRLKDGTEVKLSENKILGLMQQKIDELNHLGVDAILLLCTGEFPNFNSQVLLIKPSDVIKGIISSFRQDICPGIMVPDEDQVDMTANKWGKYNNILVSAASPYRDFNEIIKAAEKLKACDLIVMDCMGYSIKMKEAVRRYTGKPVILSRTMVARVAAEILN